MTKKDLMLAKMPWLWEMYPAMSVMDRLLLVRPTIEAAKAYATIGEVVGVVRLAYGFRYDPFDTLEAPQFIVDTLRKRR